MARLCGGPGQGGEAFFRGLLQCVVPGADFRLDGHDVVLHRLGEVFGQFQDLRPDQVYGSEFAFVGPGGVSVDDTR